MCVYTTNWHEVRAQTWHGCCATASRDKLFIIIIIFNSLGSECNMIWAPTSVANHKPIPQEFLGYHLVDCMQMGIFEATDR